MGGAVCVATCVIGCIPGVSCVLGCTFNCVPGVSCLIPCNPLSCGPTGCGPICSPICEPSICQPPVCEPPVCQPPACEPPACQPPACETPPACTPPTTKPPLCSCKTKIPKIPKIPGGITCTIGKVIGGGPTGGKGGVGGLPGMGGGTTGGTSSGGATCIGLAGGLGALAAGINRMAQGPAITTPAAVMVHGNQVALPSENYNIGQDNISQAPITPMAEQEIENAKDGGLIQHMAEGSKPDIHQGHAFGFYTPAMGLDPLKGAPSIMTHAKCGGKIVEHKPEFISEGGLHHFVKGGGTGTSDSIPAMLANGEFVIPADVVSGLGDGSNDSGAKILDEFLKTVRAHKHSHDAKQLPPDSKGPLGYLLEAKKKVK